MVRTVVAWCLLSNLWFVSSIASYKIHLSSAWYPAKKSYLDRALQRQAEYARKHYDMHLDGSKIRALICPHASLEYSGNVAAAAYRLLPYNFFKRVIILAPSHHVSFHGVGLPAEQYSSYKNSMGQIDFDEKVLKSLAKNSAWCSHQAHAHDLDHAIFMQIPFIQYFCGKDCKLVPLLIGQASVGELEAIAQLLRVHVDDKTLLVISSDLTHYGHRFNYEPFKQDQNIKQRIYQLDSLLVSKIQNQNLQEFENVLQETNATVCGQNPIKILLALLEKKSLGKTDTYVVAYENSESFDKDIDHSVSYVACVVSNQILSNLGLQQRLTGYEKNLLLTIAHERLYQAVMHKDSSNHHIVVPGLVTKALSAAKGVFVTLYKMGKDGYKQLRGCIGRVVSDKPLYESVYDLAEQAALFDRRFTPVRKEELPYIDISLSVLTELHKVQSYEDIILDRDGVKLTKFDHSAVYLPHVAKQEGWNLEQMLSSLCQKAGLSDDACRDPDVTFETFQSLDFGQDKDPLEVMYEGYEK